MGPAWGLVYVDGGASRVRQRNAAAGGVWLGISLYLCISGILRVASPCGLVWASPWHGGLRTVRLFLRQPRGPARVSQLVKKKKS